MRGCHRWLRIRRGQGQGFRRYCGDHAHFKRENHGQWAEQDRGINRLFVYLLELGGEPWLYAGQTRTLRQRLREHRDGTTKSTAGKHQALVWYEIVGSRRKAVRYEQKLKYWAWFRRGKIQRLVRRGPSAKAKAAFELGNKGR